MYTKQFADSCFIHVGLTNEIDPYIPHYLQDWGYKTLSEKAKDRGSLAEVGVFQTSKQEKGIKA